MNPWYTDYSEYMSRYFGNTKVQKLSVNTSAGCPNRDGTIGSGGCIYCNNSSFTPAYCLCGGDIAEQLERGKAFFARKYSTMKYLAYFQSYTNTYRRTVESLRREYMQALDVSDIAGLIIGTRPDCIGSDVMAMLNEIGRNVPVFIELGVESLHDDTLRLINRGHDAQTSCAAISRLAAAGLHVGVHLIAGLPGEDNDRILDTVTRICKLPVESIKLHHLQVLRGTPLASMIERGTVTVRQFEVEEYLDLCMEVIKIVPRTIAIERFLASSPPDMVISPKWGMKNYQFVDKLHNKLKIKFNTYN